MTSEASRKVRFTKHAKQKFTLLRRYGFDIPEASVTDAVTNPARVDPRDDQLLALKPLNREYAIRVVYRIVNDHIVVVTFYPVKRERFNV